VIRETGVLGGSAPSFVLPTRLGVDPFLPISEEGFVLSSPCLRVPPVPPCGGASISSLARASVFFRFKMAGNERSTRWHCDS